MTNGDFKARDFTPLIERVLAGVFLKMSCGNTVYISKNAPLEKISPQCVFGTPAHAGHRRATQACAARGRTAYIVHCSHSR